MRFSRWLARAGLFALSLGLPVAAEKLLQSHALIPCSNDGIISVNHFDIVFTPKNNSATVSFDGQASYGGKLRIELQLYVYGYKAVTKTFDPCSLNVDALCPLQKDTALKISDVPLDLSGVDLSIIPGRFTFPGNAALIGSQLSPSCSSHIGIAYSVPDLDAVVRLQIIDAETNRKVTCVQASVDNGVTVDQMGVAWAMAVLIGIGLLATVVMSILGHANIATLVAFRTLLFLGFMQSQALWGMTAINQRPLVQSWTQIWQWTMGLVGARFLQKICTWFLRATGGTPSQILTQTDEYSVIMQKRSYTPGSLVARATDMTANGGEIEVQGIERVGFRIGIEPTNIFMTSYLFYYFVSVVFLLVILFLKLVLPRLVRKSRSANLERKVVPSSDWKDFMRGSLYRIAALGYPQMCALGMWELIHRDSAAEIVLAICMWLTMTVVLCWAIFKVFQRARLSRTLRQNPAYTLYSDPVCLTRWGFLYVNYNAQAYYFMVPLFLYTLAKGFVIAFGQSNPLAQAIVLLITETAFLVITCVIRPYMNKMANGFAITAAVLNFLSSIFFLFFTNVFNVPELVGGVMEVLFFFLNAIFMLALLIFFLISFYYVVTLKQPAEQYDRLSDNRSSTVLVGNRRITELQPLEKNLEVEDGHMTSSTNVWEPVSTRSPSEEDIAEAPQPHSGHVIQPTLPSIQTSDSDSSRSRQYAIPRQEERLV
ncbi:Flavin carrier protein 2 [Penicillium rolfsii]|nr:Flavin carrier protein 2 [Penicillium rolfsii]